MMIIIEQKSEFGDFFHSNLWQGSLDLKSKSYSDLPCKGSTSGILTVLRIPKTANIYQISNRSWQNV